MSPKFAPQNVASIVKLLVIPIWRHITTRAVDSLHLRTRNLHPLNENLSGAWDKGNDISLEGRKLLEFSESILEHWISHYIICMFTKTVQLVATKEEEKHH